jgi:hypothetical protein
MGQPTKQKSMETEVWRLEDVEVPCEKSFWQGLSALHEVISRARLGQK